MFLNSRTDAFFYVVEMKSNFRYNQQPNKEVGFIVTRDIAYNCSAVYLLYG